MSLVYTGNSRARKVTVTKYVNGIPQAPVTYPTNTDMANGSFTYSGGSMNIPAIDGDTPHAELSSLSEALYAAYLVALQTYAQEQQPGLNFATATVTPGYTAVIEDDPNCPPAGTAVGTTTTTDGGTGTTTEEPGTTTTTGEVGVCYSIWIPTASLTDGGNDLYIEYRNPEGALTESTAISLPDTGEWIDGVVINMCSMIFPLFQYGPAGSNVEPGTIGIDVRTGGACNGTGECSSITTTTTGAEPATTTTTASM